MISERGYYLIAQVVFKNVDGVFPHFKENSGDVEGLLGSRLCQKRFQQFISPSNFETKILNYLGH